MPKVFAGFLRSRGGRRFPRTFFGFRFLLRYHGLFNCRFYVPWSFAQGGWKGPSIAARLSKFSMGARKAHNEISPIVCLFPTPTLPTNRNKSRQNAEPGPLRAGNSSGQLNIRLECGIIESALDLTPDCRTRKKFGLKRKTKCSHRLRFSYAIFPVPS